MRVPPSAVINLIRENLNDRYQKGFPIIRELVQNADDAGATCFDIGWVQGLPSAKHPLLRGPALFVLNNGRLTTEDLSAIDCIGLSSKVNERSSIGKFGLGLKSVFHLCEAFFYIAGGKAIKPKGPALVNPWADGQGNDSLHPDWGMYGAEDRAPIEAMLGGLMDPSGWLCIWIPLRQKSHTKNPIRQDCPGDERDPGTLMPADLPDRLAALLPLLRKLRLLRGWASSGPSGQLARTFAVELDGQATRRRYPDLGAGKAQPLVGIIRTQRLTDGATTEQRYAGLELCLADPDFSDLKASQLWPKYTSTDEQTGAYNSQADKAEPHCAVCFFQRPATGGQARLAITRSVFLPVDEPFAQVACAGDMDFEVILHGYTFVDAGRSRIDGWDAEALEEPRDEPSLRRKWNRMLTQRGILPLVLPALDLFARGGGVSEEGVTVLTKALARSGLLADARYRAIVGGQWQWVCCLARQGRAWKLIGARESLYQVPGLDSFPPGIQYSVFPRLAELTAKRHITTAGWPRVGAVLQPAAWPADLLCQLLDLREGDVFLDPVRLRYLVEFLESCPVEVRGSDAVTEQLRELGCRALLAAGVTRLRTYPRLMQRFAGTLGREARLALRYSKPIGDAILAGIAKADAGILALPEGLDSQENPAGNHVSVGDGRKILQMVGDPRAPWASDKDAIETVSSIALQIVEAVGEQKGTLLRQCSELRLFRARDVAADASILLSWDDLERLRQRRTLFVVSPEKVNKALSECLPHERVVRVDGGDGNVADVLFGEGAIPRCTAEECIKTLLAKPALSEPEQRATLLAELRDSTGAEGHRAAVRYLLHGQARDDGGMLLVDTGGRRDSVWAKLTADAVRLAGARWRMVPQELSGIIPPARRQGLGLAEVSASSAVELVREVGPERIDCSTLTEEEREQVILGIDDDELLRRLRVHQDIDGNLVSITAGRTFVDSEFAAHLDSGLRRSVTILRSYPSGSLRGKQLRLADPLSPPAAIRLALAQEKPVAHWHTIMEALGRSGASPSQLETGLQTQLQKTAWLPTQQGRNVPPADVIDLPGLEDDVARLVSTLHGAFSDVGSLLGDVRGHASIARLRHLFPSQRDALDMLSAIMAGDEQYRLGVIGEPPIDEAGLADCLTTFEGSSALMPAWPIINRVQAKTSAAACCEALLPPLLAPIPAERMVGVLNHLAARHETLGGTAKAAVLRVHQRYLRAAAAMPDFASRILPGVRLLNRRGEWRRTDQLCCGIDGIDDGDLLQREQEAAIHLSLRLPGTDSPNATQSATGPARPRSHTGTPGDAASVLKGYFGPWEGIVEREVIGGFLCLLGDDPGVKALAESYLHNWGLRVVRDWLHWEPLGGGAKSLVSGAGKDIHEVMADQRFVVETVPAKAGTQRVMSLVGTPFEARLREQSELGTLFVGSGLGLADRSIDPKTGHQVNRVRLRELSHLDRSQRKHLTELLHGSARALLELLYCQLSSNVDEVWQRLDQSEQLEIEVAQETLLEDAFTYLPQYGLRTNERLRPLLRKWDDVRSRIVQERQAHAPGWKDGAGEKEKRQIQEQLRALIESDPEVMRITLQAVRAKIGRTYQYRGESIPFELFQNADDAYVELAAMLGVDSPAGSDTFVAEQSADRLAFVHWGRRINQSRLGIDGTRHSAYDHDLRKMLVLQDSDKAAEDGAGALTGKFGLGFKSVYLMCDRPRVVSGRLGFEVVGGIYPKALVGEELQRLQQRLAQAAGSDGRAGTIIELTVDSALNENPGQVIGEFTQLAHVLVAFARRIRRCELRLGDKVHRIAWEGRPVRGVQAARIGALRPADGEESAGLLLEAREGGLLVALGARGFQRLPDSVPSIWVTAPTQHRLGVGFAVNGPFDLDVGRAQLARDSSTNAELAGRIGHGLGETLRQLHAAAHGEGWEAFRAELGLASDVNPYTFWESLWKLVAGAVDKAKEGEVARLLKGILWGSASDSCGVTMLLERAPCLPTGLWCDHQVLTQLGRVTRTVKGALEEEAVFAEVSRWPSFRAMVAPGTAVSHARVWAPLSSSLDGASPRGDLRLATAIGWEIGTGANVSPEVANRLGALITREFLAELEEDSRVDHGEVQARIEQLRFQAEDGSYRPARELLLADPALAEHRDEELRARFAPRDRVLASAYRGPGIAFFEACRRQLQAPAKEMADWALHASTDAQRISVLEYLLTGEQGLALANELSWPRCANSWLTGQTGSLLLARFGLNEQSVLRGRLNLIPQDPVWEPPVVAPPAPADVLEEVYARWTRIGRQEILQYERSIYPAGRMLALPSDVELVRHDSGSRQPWLILLMLGSSHMIGRTQWAGHRNYVLRCQQKGWMDVFSKPDIIADEWIRVLEEYWDGKPDDEPDYRLWMQQFISVHQFARWLPDYVEAFMTVDRMPGLFPLDQITRPRSSETFAGGGINAPNIDRSLGCGVCFVLRELVRGGVLRSPHVQRYCYLPSQRVRAYLGYLGCALTDGANPENSVAIHDFLVEHLGPERATFNLAFDLALDWAARSQVGL